MGLKMLEIDQKVMEVIEMIDSNPEGVPLNDLFARSDLVDEDLEAILMILEDFNFKMETCEKSGDKRLVRITQRDRIDYGFSPREQYFVRELEKLQSKICVVSLIPENELELVIKRVLFVEGKISVIGERLDTGGLEVVPIFTISTAKEIEAQYVPNYTDSEVDDFLIALRKVSGGETRLVLKLDVNESRDITPKYHFARKPCLISNMQGHKIWAASVELTDDLFAWLFSINDCVEIMDPIEAKKGILKYCEESLYQEIEKQKVS